MADQPADPVDDAFSAALSADAAVPPPSIPAPPRVSASADPDAPHGRDDAGAPVAPFGIGKNGRPRIKPAGPGRGGKAEAPRTTTAVAKPAAAAAPAGMTDYTEDLSGLGISIWMGGAMLPVTRPYAQLLKRQLPEMVPAWNVAANKNPWVRGKVEQLAGDGSWAWVIGVSVATAPFITGCLALLRAEKDPERKAAQGEVKAELAAECRAELTDYIRGQVAMAAAAPPEGQEAA